MKYIPKQNSGIFDVRMLQNILRSILFTLPCLLRFNTITANVVSSP